MNNKHRARIFFIGFACLMANITALATEPVVERQGFVDVAGGPVWYKAVGAGPGIPLMVLHGGPGGTSCGYAALEPLASERPVIRYDQLGTGRSGRPDDLSLWTVERFVEELHTVREALGLEQMHLLGHSWGGSLAAAYVLEKGTEGIVSLILSSPLLSTPQWMEDANLLRARLPEDVQLTLAEHEAAGTFDSEAYQEASKVFYERHVWAGPEPESAAACDGAPWNPVIYEYMWGPTEFNATGTLLDFDVTARLNEIDVPVLFITGELDEARPETVASFHELVPGAQMTVIEDAAHATIGKKPDQYMKVLEAFLDSAEAGEGQ
jgi:proline iminopeptidase